jgi:hypothetical protein
MKEKIPQSSAGVGKEDLTHGKTKRKEKFFRGLLLKKTI